MSVFSGKVLISPLIAFIVISAPLAGCVAPDIPYQQLEARYATEASAFAALPSGVRVHYRDEGPKDAPPIVLIHGFAASLHAWEPWVARLTEEYRLISLDLPGHGLTRAPSDYRLSPQAAVGVVRDLTRELQIERFVLVGNSMGGEVAWEYATSYPDSIEGLVLVNSAGINSDGAGSGPPGVFRLLNNPLGRAIMRNLDPRPLAKRGLRLAYQDRSLVTEELVDRYVDLARAPGHRALLTSGRGASPTASDRIGKIEAPTLVMVGLKDQVIPPEESARFAAIIPKAQLVTYPEGGHLPMEQMPDESARDLRAFLRTISRRP